MNKIFNKIRLIGAILVLGSCKSQNNNSQLYEVLIPYREVVDIKQFGALPNDNKDDSEAIQKAIDYAIRSSKSSVVYCPAGVYNLSTGLLLANHLKSGEYRHITITLTGPAPAYSDD